MNSMAILVTFTFVSICYLIWTDIKRLLGVVRGELKYLDQWMVYMIGDAIGVAAGTALVMFTVIHGTAELGPGWLIVMGAFCVELCLMLTNSFLTNWAVNRKEKTKS